MLEVAVDDGDHGDVFREFFAGNKATDAADIEFDFDAGLGGGVEGGDDVGILEGVSFCYNFRGEALLCALRLAGDEVEQAGFHRGGRGDQALEAEELRTAGDGVEKEGGIVSILWLAGEVGEIGVEAGGCLVVVTGAKVDVAADVARFAAENEADLGVGLEVFHAIDDLCSGALEFVGAVEVAGLVEAGLELDEDGDVLAVFRSADQGIDDAGLSRGAV